MAEKKKTKKKRIPWHPAFYAAAEFDFRENKEDLIFEQEKQLSKEPLRIDLLIIKKNEDAVIKNEIGHFFRKYNIIEYKSPDDTLNFNDYLKTVSYTGLYQSLEKEASEVAFEEITISFFRESYPRKLVENLKRKGITVRKTSPGIYILGGKIMYPTQIVVIKELGPQTAPAMRILSKNLQHRDLDNFIAAAQNKTDVWDRDNIDAILHASGCANEAVFQEVMGVTTLTDFLEELIKDRIEEREAKSRAEGRAEGKAEGRAEGHAEGRAEGKAEGRAEGEAKGRAEGHAEGEAKGRDYCAELMGILLKAGRIDDALRAATDKDYLNQLIDEMVKKKMPDGILVNGE